MKTKNKIKRFDNIIDAIKNDRLDIQNKEKVKYFVTLVSDKLKLVEREYKYSRTNLGKILYLAANGALKSSNILMLISSIDFLIYMFKYYDPYLGMKDFKFHKAHTDCPAFVFNSQNNYLTKILNEFEFFTD